MSILVQDATYPIKDTDMEDFGYFFSKIPQVSVMKREEPEGGREEATDALSGSG